MTKTTGSRKVQAMAAVINELVAQRKMMRMRAMQMVMGTIPADHAQHHQPG